MFFRLILLFFFMLSNLAWSAAPIAIIDDRTPAFNLVESSSYFIDEEQNLSFESISSLNFSHHFRPLNRSHLQLGFIKGNIWIRSEVALLTSDDSDIFLQVSSPKLSYLDIYLPTMYGNEVQAELGNARPYSNKKIESPNYIFPIPSDAPPIFTVYLKLSSNLPINAQLELKTLSQLNLDNQKELTLTGIIIGVLLTIFTGSLFFYFRFLHPMYLIYCSLLISIVIFHLALHDQITQFFPNTIGVQERVYNFTSFYCLCSMIFFSRYFMDSKKLLPTLDIILVCLGTFTALLAFIFTLSPESIKISLLSITAFTTLLLLSTHSIAAFIKKMPYAGYYLAARLVLLVGHFFWMLSIYGIIPDPILMGWGFTITIIIESLIHFIGMIARTTPLFERQARKGHQTQTELLDFLSDLSGRLRRHINVIGGSLSHLEKTTQQAEAQPFLNSSQTANQNINNLIKRIDYLSDIKNQSLKEQTAPALLSQIIDKAYSNFQDLDQDLARIELTPHKVERVEVLKNAELIEHLIETLIQELKHFTDQTLILDMHHYDINKKNMTLLQIDCSPIPAHIQINAKSFDLGMSYITYLLEYLEGDAKLVENEATRHLHIQVPLHARIKSKASMPEEHQKFSIILFGQEDEDQKHLLTLLQGYPNNLEVFADLEHLLDRLEAPKNRRDGTIIIVLDNGGQIPHVTQQRLKPLLRYEDQSFLVSDNVKMSLDYAKKLGFDDLISCSSLEKSFSQQFLRLLQKGSRLKNTPLSHIKNLSKMP